MPAYALCGKRLNVCAYSAAGAVYLSTKKKGVIVLRLFLPSALKV
jgi:hypothetical protein